MKKRYWLFIIGIIAVLYASASTFEWYKAERKAEKEKCGPSGIACRFEEELKKKKAYVRPEKVEEKVFRYTEIKSLKDYLSIDGEKNISLVNSKAYAFAFIMQGATCFNIVGAWTKGEDNHFRYVTVSEEAGDFRKNLVDSHCGSFSNENHLCLSPQEASECRLEIGKTYYLNVIHAFPGELERSTCREGGEYWNKNSRVLSHCDFTIKEQKAH